MIYYRGNNQKVIEAVRLANLILQDDSELYARIIARESFHNTKATPAAIAKSMKTVFKTEVTEVRLYWSWWWSSAIGYFDAKKPNQVNTSKRYVNRKSTDVFELASHFVHEFVHKVDYHDADRVFGHAFRHHSKRHESAPYWIGYMAGYLLKKHYSVA